MHPKGQFSRYSMAQTEKTFAFGYGNMRSDLRGREFLARVICIQLLARPG